MNEIDNITNLDELIEEFPDSQWTETLNIINKIMSDTDRLEREINESFNPKKPITIVRWQMSGLDHGIAVNWTLKMGDWKKLQVVVVPISASEVSIREAIEHIMLVDLINAVTVKVDLTDIMKEQA